MCAGHGPGETPLPEASRLPGDAGAESVRGGGRVGGSAGGGWVVVGC